MLRNYIKIAFRNLQRRKFFSFLNITGLAIGLSCCTLIVLYIADELSYDRFHTNAERIYRVGTDIKFGELDALIGATPGPLAATLIQEFPEVEESTRYNRMGVVNVRVGDKIFSEKEAFNADSNFFNLFTFPMLEGNPDNALHTPDGVVLTQASAERFFGRHQEVIGNVLTIDGKLSKVTGIIKNIPSNSYLQFNMLLPAALNRSLRSNNWGSLRIETYVLLKEGHNANALEAKYPLLIDKYVGPKLSEGLGYTYEEFLAKGGRWGFFNESLTDIHLKERTKEGAVTESMKTIYVFALIAVFILVLGCVNFMNLSTARSAERAKEVGIRKVLGSVRKVLVGQFIAEAILITSISMLISVLITEAFLPAFNQLADKSLTTQHLFDPVSLVLIVLSVLLIGTLAGSYPAFYLTSFKPVEVLKGKLNTGKSNWLRSSLVVFQFCVSITLIICTIIVYNQLNFMNSQELGFTKDNILVVQNGRSLDGKGELFKTKLNTLPQVKAVSISNALPALNYDNRNAYRNLNGKQEDLLILTIDADFDIIKTLGLKLKQGRDFDAQLASDTNAIIINEAAAIKLGFKDDVIGKEIDQYEDPRHKIIGVVEDFHLQSLRAGIEPIVIMPSQKGQFISVKVDGQSIEQAVAGIEAAWKEMAPDTPFEYTFFDEDFAAQYKAEQRLGKVFTLFTGLAIVVACLGLFGLAAFTAEQRTKEIGIRKVLGASVASIAGLLSKDFLKLVLIANLIAWPLAWWAMSKWLEDFAYRIEIGWWVFALAGLSALGIALITVSYQAIKAALANPVKSLRTE